MTGVGLSSSPSFPDRLHACQASLRAAGCWAVPAVGGAALGDARLAQRLVPLLDCLSEHPTASIPQACGTWAHTKAAYRFFDNPRVTPAAILAPHRQQTGRRVAAYPVILAVQDTTVFNLTLHRHTQGLGPIGQAGLSGFFCQVSLSLTAIVSRSLTRNRRGRGRLGSRRPLSTGSVGYVGTVPAHCSSCVAVATMASSTSRDWAA